MTANGPSGAPAEPGARADSGDGLHRNVWVASGTSFLTDVSSEMLQNVLPLFLANVLGVRTWAVGVVEGLAESVGEATDRFLERRRVADVAHRQRPDGL